MLEIVIAILFIVFITGVLINYNAGSKLGTNFTVIGFVGLIISGMISNTRKNAVNEYIQNQNQT